MKKIIIICLFIVFSACAIWPCGPYFNDMYIFKQSERDLFAYPKIDAYGQIEFLVNKFYPKDADLNGDSENIDSAEISGEKIIGNSEIEELTISLKNNKNIDLIVADFVEFRKNLKKFIRQKKSSYKNYYYDGIVDSEEEIFRNYEKYPLKEKFSVDFESNNLKNLPAEFNMYIDGAVKYHNDEFDSSIKIWKQLLEIPDNERKYKSVWAAFMIAKAYLSIHDTSNADSYFILTRQLVEQGFYDSLNLGDESYGWQALAQYESGSFIGAVHLYSQANDAGSLLQIYPQNISDSIIISICEDSLSRKILTIILLNTDYYSLSAIDSLKKLPTDIAADDCDKFAYIFYLNGDIEKTLEFLSFTKQNTPLTLWLKSQLALRTGNIEEAIAIKKNITDTEIFNKSERFFARNIKDKVNCEIGMLYLNQKKYKESLNCF